MCMCACVCMCMCVHVHVCVSVLCMLHMCGSMHVLWVQAYMYVSVYNLHVAIYVYTYICKCHYWDGIAKLFMYIARVYSATLYVHTYASDR